MNYRSAVVAGSFYPEDSEQLTAQLDSFLKIPVSTAVQPKALIVPHAGYIYSGMVAGYAYAKIINYAESIHRVVILGPSHRVALQGCAISSYDYFSTPLGDVSVDKQSQQL
ncbi:MAG: AmmeMemoRadiSam system protein B, partial [Psychromonas sp.]|nr:AmmeMemoRadiSam system protein B [Psychromonas sp.]